MENVVDKRSASPRRSEVRGASASSRPKGVRSARTRFDENKLRELFNDPELLRSVLKEHEPE
jgi:hypothetical protein